MRVLTVALILACGVSSYASDPPPDAKARAALALAKSKAGPGLVAQAPAPRPAVLDYAEAKRHAIERNAPVVVFVGCDPVKVPDTLVAVVPEMDGYVAGTVLICYPSGGHLWADAKLPCPAPPEDIAKAVKVAGKKVDVKPRRLDWS